MNGLSKSRLMNAAIIFALFLLVSTAAMAQSGDRDSDGDDAVAVNLGPAGVTALDSGSASGPALSKGFVLASLRAMGAMRDWQGHLAYMIRNGYPLAEQWLSEDSNRAADLVALAGQAASTRGDRAAINELNNQYRNLQRWSDTIVESKRRLQLANLYMTPNGLDGDALFQKTVSCANFLTPMLASGRLSESVSCQ